MNNWEIVISGSGGQGVITAGIILAAAALRDGNNVIQSQSYGPEARGGASRSEVLISTEELAYPKIQACNLLIALTQQALDKYRHLLAAKGMVLTDTNIDTSDLGSSLRIYHAPIFTAVGKIGNPMVANTLVLGVLNSLTNVVSEDSLVEAIRSRVPAATVAINLEALQEGSRMGEYLKKEGTTA